MRVTDQVQTDQNGHYARTQHERVQTVQFSYDPYLSGAIWHEVIAHGALPTHVHISNSSHHLNRVTDIAWSNPTAADPAFATAPSDWKQNAHPQLDIMFSSAVEPLIWRLFSAAMKIAYASGTRCSLERPIELPDPSVVDLAPVSKLLSFSARQIP